MNANLNNTNVEDAPDFAVPDDLAEDEDGYTINAPVPDEDYDESEIDFDDGEGQDNEAYEEARIDAAAYDHEAALSNNNGYNSELDDTALFGAKYDFDNDSDMESVHTTPDYSSQGTLLPPLSPTAGLSYIEEPEDLYGATPPEAPAANVNASNANELVDTAPPPPPMQTPANEQDAE
ncbi:unnamed protein product [Clonostachys rhizophaga]|uniref:Uncharacterized protein n=1 Tax=Clonostachys rhizophaga TaxID=160324 RepID=A0A9N9VHL5_9HYPO|nr:unnamed protein product [Clonostachys rhizophaga]